ncbi:MAG: hypothetical protein Q9159_005279 [Coniocarpon cinnabarinum]
MAHSSGTCLSENEIRDLFYELEDADTNLVTYANVKAKFEAILSASSDGPGITDRIARRATRRPSVVQHTNPKTICILNEFYPKHKNPLNEADFTTLVASWNIPSKSNSTAKNDADETIQKRVSLLRQVKAFLSLEARQMLFIAFVIALQVAFGVYQLVMFLHNRPARHALGWGVVVAKTFAGPIYPTIFLMILSMSRWLATLCRKIPGMGRVINWDLHRGFHIYMCCSCLVFSTIHGIAHMSGDFVWGSRPSHQLAVVAFWGKQWYHTTYTKYLSLLPGWSGILALAIFWLIFFLSLPKVRNWNFEVFQLAHLLLFPFVGLLAAHGTLALLHSPMLGYFLIIPTITVVTERVHRLIRGLMHMPATLKTLDKDTVTLTIRRRWDGPWKCAAGQYILLQVPSISWWQWHPFTISSCNSDAMTVHIRHAGNWTKMLRRLPRNDHFCVSVDGPFGAPAQQIYQFDRSIVIGSGIGVTPMSSIANDFANKMSRNKNPWKRLDRSRHRNDGSPFARVYNPFINRSLHSSDGSMNEGSKLKCETHSDAIDVEKAMCSVGMEKTLSASVREVLQAPKRRRVDFHWITRDPPSLQWFSDYLNRAQEAAEAHSQGNSEVHSRDTSAATSAASSFIDLPAYDNAARPMQLQFNINTYVTAPNKTMSDHVFKHLVDRYRSPAQDHSVLTGLKTASHFRRPDFSAVLRDYHAEMGKQGWAGGEVGVFYCGNPGLGATLKEACRTQTTLAWADGSKIRYRFITEVF